MAYSRLKTGEFGPLQSGLSTVGYSLDGSTWTTTGVTEYLAGSGLYQATIAFPDGFRGVLTWRTGPTDPLYAYEEINPESSEIPSQVWSNPTRALTAFGFQVAVSGFGSGGPTFRNQDEVVNPTWDDVFSSMWAAANAKEVEDDAAKTWVRYMPNGDPMRSFVLTTNENGDPIGRE